MVTNTLSTLRTRPPAKIRGEDALTPPAAMALAKSKPTRMPPMRPRP